MFEINDFEITVPLKISYACNIWVIVVTTIETGIKLVPKIMKKNPMILLCKIGRCDYELLAGS